jgi:hypothetical protein
MLPLAIAGTRETRTVRELGTSAMDITALDFLDKTSILTLSTNYDVGSWLSVRCVGRLSHTEGSGRGELDVWCDGDWYWG